MTIILKEDFKYPLNNDYDQHFIMFVNGAKGTECFTLFNKSFSCSWHLIIPYNPALNILKVFHDKAVPVLSALPVHSDSFAKK